MFRSIRTTSETTQSIPTMGLLNVRARACVCCAFVRVRALMKHVTKCTVLIYYYSICVSISIKLFHSS